MRGFWYQKITLFCKRRWKKYIIAIVFLRKTMDRRGGGALKYFWSPITRVSYRKAVFVVFLLFWCSFRCKFHANAKKKKNSPIFVASASVTSHFVLLTKTKSPGIFPTLIVVHQAVRLTNNNNREKHVH